MDSYDADRERARAVAAESALVEAGRAYVVLLENHSRGYNPEETAEAQAWWKAANAYPPSEKEGEKS